MKIVQLVAENFKKLRAVEITPTGEIVVISGRNGAGKSSILDAIWAALGGAKHIQAVPIRKGHNKARIKLDLGELVVERRFTEKGSSLSVESSDGARYGSPQTILDALLGALAFDPLAFVSQEPRKQFETLRGIVKLEVDVDQLDALNRGDFEHRTDINRDAKTLRAQADGIAVAPCVPAEPIDTSALVRQMAEAATANGELETRKVRREQMAEEIARVRLSAERARAEAKRQTEIADTADREAAALREKLDKAVPLPAPVDVDALSSQLETAQALNKLVEQRARRAQLAGEAADLEGKARELTASIDARMQAKADAIAKAPMPVEGLGFGDGVVLFGGIPFDQASTAEQLRVSLAIAMAANPKLRVIRIKEGSLLDKDGQRLIAEMAQAHDYQLWIEQVDDSGKMGFYIEDGQVVAVDGEPVTQQPEPEPDGPVTEKGKAAHELRGGKWPEGAPPKVNPAPKPRPSSPW